MGVRAFLAGFVVAGLVLFAISTAKADSEWTVPQPTATVTTDQSSKNFPKTGRFLPGEEVVTPTGKKMRVWSTEGPVPVTQPPTPGYGAPNGIPYGTEVIVDQREPTRRRMQRGPTEDTER